MEMHNIKNNPDAMKEIAKEMEKKSEEHIECFFGGLKVTLSKILLSGKSYFYITPKKPHPFTARYYYRVDEVHLRKTNVPCAAYLINELIEIVKSGDFEFC